MFPCLADANALTLGNAANATGSVVIAAPWRQYYTIAKVADVLAPTCWCGINDCSEAESRSKCKSQFGQDSEKAFSSTDSDKNGHSCWCGYVPQCSVSDLEHRVEYLYKSMTMEMTTPSGYLPGEPAWLKAIEDAFSS